MASCKIGHVYIVETAIAKTPKAKFALCVCLSPDWFVWINTNAPHHGLDQVILPAGCHELVRHESHLDLSRIVAHPTWELEGAREFACISADIAQDILDAINAGLSLLPPRQVAVLRDAATSLL